MILEKFIKPFPTTNDFHILNSGAQRLIVKVYRGKDADRRFLCERNNLLTWKIYGFNVPEYFDLKVQSLDRPYLVMNFIDGSNLRKLFTDPCLSTSKKMCIWKQTLETIFHRHSVALHNNRIDLVHSDSNTGNVMIKDSSIFFLDLETPPKFDNIIEACAVEIATLARWTVRDLGIEHLYSILEELAKTYKNQENILIKIINRTTSRPFQILHRWKDQKKKLKDPSEVTKYDIADGLKKILYP